MKIKKLSEQHVNSYNEIHSLFGNDSLQSPDFHLWNTRHFSNNETDLGGGKVLSSTQAKMSS
jgi:hypothetical protein